MKCKLCNKNEANKKKTHYLTDSIIRSCLNYEGLSGNKNREKGFYFDISSDTPFIEFNFQQNTPPTVLEEVYGREVKDEEIKKAYETPFAVDNIFCSECEKIFTEIETSFINKFLKRFRNVDLKKTHELIFTEIKDIRLFFLLQVWRTYICEDFFSISEVSAERLRKIILNHKSITESELKTFPLSITYLETTGDTKEYTSNYVLISNDQNPNLIFMNDFVIQFYTSSEFISFFDFHNLNDRNSFREFININEKKFKIKVIGNQERKTLLNSLAIRDAEQKISFYRDLFIKLWNYCFKSYPDNDITEEYLKFIVGDDKHNILKHSKETISLKTELFFKTRIK